MTQMRTTRLSTLRRALDRAERDGAERTAQPVTVYRLGRGVQKSSGRSVRDTLAEAGIPVTGQESVQVGQEEVHDLERILKPGDYVIVGENLRGGERAP